MSVLLPSSCLGFLLSVGFHSQRYWGLHGTEAETGSDSPAGLPQGLLQSPLMAPRTQAMPWDVWAGRM